MSDSPLPPDLGRLHVLRDWLTQQQARNDVLGTYLRLEAERVDAAIEAATPAVQEYRLQGMRVPPGRSVLHLADCWIAGGDVIPREAALIAVRDEAIAPGLEYCTACWPKQELFPDGG